MAIWAVPLAHAAAPGLLERLVQMPLRGALAVMAVATGIRVALVFARPGAGKPGERKTLRVAHEVLDVAVYVLGLYLFLVRPFVFQSSYVPSGSMIPTLRVGDLLASNNLVYRYSEPRHGDVVVFRAPTDAALRGQRADFDMVKRVVGLPGDLVEVRAGRLLRNGVQVAEPTLGSPMAFDFKLVAYRGAERRWRNLTIPVQMHMVAGRRLANYGTPTAPRYAVAMDPRTWRYFPLDSLVETDYRLMRELIDAPAAAVPKGMLLVMGDNRRLSFDGRGWGLVSRRAVIGRAEFVWWPPGRWGSPR